MTKKHNSKFVVNNHELFYYMTAFPHGRILINIVLVECSLKIDRSALNVTLM